MCGNCNPAIESMAVARGIARAMGASLVPYNSPCAQGVLVINGCERGCVFLPGAFPLEIAGLSLDRIPCTDQETLISLAAKGLFALSGERFSEKEFPRCSAGGRSQNK